MWFFSYKVRLGIDIGDTEILVFACPIIGRQYVYGAQGRMTLEKQWSQVVQAYSYQVTLHDITVHNPTFIQFSSIEDVFTPKSICFMLGYPHYGSKGEVLYILIFKLKQMKSIYYLPNHPLYLLGYG